MLSRTRLWVVGLSGIAVVALIVLAAGLSGLELLPGQRLARAPQAGGVEAAASLPEGDTLPFIIWRILSLVLVILFPISVIRFFISPQMRKRVIRDFLMFVGALMLYYLIARALGETGLFGASQQAGAGAAFDPASDQAVVDPRLDPPAWLPFAVSLVLIVLLLGLARLAWRRYLNQSNPYQQLAREAQEAVDDLRAGRDVKNVVVRCYADMCQTLSRERGIRRQASMTPREFEARLARLGLPREQVLRLTRLFEAARYGSQTPGARDEDEAVTCLSAIAADCARLA